MDHFLNGILSIPEIEALDSVVYTSDSHHRTSFPLMTLPKNLRIPGQDDHFDL
jgi:hypothetical protein